MDQDQRLAGDGAERDERDPARDGADALPGGTQHSLFNAMLGKLAGKKDASSGAGEEQPPDDDHNASDGNREQQPDSSELKQPTVQAPGADEANTTAARAKKPWWNVFRVKSNADEPFAGDGLPIAPAFGPAGEPEPDTPRSDQYAETSPDLEPGMPLDGAGDEQPFIADPNENIPVTETKSGTSFIAKLKNIRDQLFPAADRPVIDDHQEAAESPYEEDHVSDQPLTETASAVVPEVNAQDMSHVPRVDDDPEAYEPGVSQPAPDPTTSIPSEQPQAVPKQDFFGRFAFWKKRADPTAEPVSPREDATQVIPVSDELEVAVQEEGFIQGVVAPVSLDDAPEPPAPALAGQPAPDPEITEAEEFRPVKISPLYHVGEFFITLGGWIVARFTAILPSPRAPLDEVLAGKLAHKERLERDIRARKKDVAALARKLRRGRFERKDILEARSKARADLNRIQSTLKSRSADVAALEKQGMVLQTEIQLAASRHETLLKDIDNGHLQWESLTGTIAQTKAQLDTVTTELSIKRSDSASLDRLMEEHRRELSSATAETARLEGVRKATEEALQDFRAQIASLDQDRISQETYVRETGAEAARIRKAFEEQSHQKDVLESVLAQLSQDVQVRQKLMQQLLDEGMRVKTETDQRSAQRDLLASTVADLSSEKEQLQQDAVRFRDETRSFEEARRAAADETGRVTAELKRLQDECEERGRQVADLSAKQEVHELLSQKITAMKDDGLSLAKKLDDLRNQKDLTEKALNSYRRELAAVDTSIAQKKNERSRLDQQAREIDEKIGTFKKDVDLYTSQKSQLSDAIEAAHGKLRSLEEQISAKQEEHGRIDQHLLQVRGALASVEGELQRMDESARSRRTELEDISSRHAALEQQLDAGRSEVARLTDTGKELAAQIEQNTVSKASLIAQVQELKRIMAATAPENEKLQHRRRELEGWIGEAVQFQQQQQGAIERQLTTLKQQQQEMADLTARIEQGAARLDKLNDDLAHLDQEKAIRSQSIEDELARLNQQLSRTHGAIKDAERELQERSERRIGTIEAIQKLEEERDLLAGEVAALSQQAAQVKALQAKADELTATMTAGQKRLEEMFHENQRLAQEKAALQQSIQQAGAEHADTREQQHRFAEEVQQIQNNLESLRQTRDKLQDELSRQEGMLKSFAEENERSRQTLATQLDDVQNDLDDKQRKLDSAGDLLRQTESEISSKTITRDQMDTAIAQLKQQHADALAQVEAATGGIEDQKKLVQQQLDTLTAETEKARRSYAELDKSVKDKAAEETGLLKRLKMLSTEAGQYQSMLKQWSELSRKIEEQKRVLEDLELQAEKKSGLFT